ncbi:hypothetical protein OUZ56_007477 [Daphnia magna]|uniref:Uncharacterized protein n=1 Tax=Daphnia magna TaxID=35525 RepID=A0ABR0AA27_9CRUS|nr:hypothetical protein OUZ56_007477 [Daphnia magna]
MVMPRALFRPSSHHSTAAIDVYNDLSELTSKKKEWNNAQEDKTERLRICTTFLVSRRRDIAVLSDCI